MADAHLDKSSPLWKNLDKEFNFQLYTTEEDVPFNNSTLCDKLRFLQNQAEFAPLIARDIQSNKDFAPSSSINTWEIVFNEEWQNNDRYDIFNKWCKNAHISEDYDDIMERFENCLKTWQYTLNVPSDTASSEWFRPPTFPSTLKISLEMELTSDWSSFYKKSLNTTHQRIYNINFSINRLYTTSHCNLIDAIFFAKCVNWDAAYDPKHSARTNIPIYWIFAEISIDFPMVTDENGTDMTYTQNIFSVPISCYGLMDVEVNAIKDWYKLSPYCPECRDLRGKLQLNDDVAVFIGSHWRNGKIIDCVIMDNNEINNKQRNEPVVEYLQVQCTNDAIIQYNRYDDRLRPCLNTQSITYESKILLNDDDSKYDDENEKLLTPPIDIEQNAPPTYDIGRNIKDTESIHNVIQVTDPRIEREHKVDEYKVGPNDATTSGLILSEENDNINEGLLNSFDPKNKEIMKQYQTDLRETMETMQKLALRRTVATDIFRPVHLVCPRLAYRVLLTDDNEMNMTVVSRNDEYDYIELKMIDTEDVELSEMRVFMTKQQLFEHCTTYFHFADMKQANNDDFELKPKMKEKEVIHNVPPKIPIQDDDHGLDTIHQYIRTKDSSISPKRRNIFTEEREESKDNNDEDPRSHLKDEVLCSFLHDINGEEEDKDNNDNWITDGFVKADSVDSAMDSKHDNSFIMSAQQQFIDSDHNRVASLNQTSIEPIGAASIINMNISDISQDVIPKEVEISNELPRTPKMLGTSPSIDEEDELDSKQLQPIDDDIKDETEHKEEVHDSINTKGVDLAESDDNDEIANNNRARGSVKRIGTAPNEGKYEENENDILNFNDIGINEYDEIDDVINDLNDSDDINVPIQRIYTAKPSCFNGYFIFCIILSIILLPILRPYLPPKYDYFDPNKAQLHWRYYWNNYNYLVDNVMQKLSEFLSDLYSMTK